MDNFIGEIRMFPYSRIPTGWKACEGQTLPVSEFQALYSLLGVQFGGDGHTYFKLPDLRGRVIVGAGLFEGVPYENGTAGGAEALTLQDPNLGAHVHDVAAVSGSADQYIGAGHVLAGTPVPMYGSNGGNVTTMSPSTVETTGGGQPHDNMQPSTVCAFCIAVDGLYPTWS